MFSGEDPTQRDDVCRGRSAALVDSDDAPVVRSLPTGGFAVALVGAILAVSLSALVPVEIGFDSGACFASAMPMGSEGEAGHELLAHANDLAGLEALADRAERYAREKGIDLRALVERAAAVIPSSVVMMAASSPRTIDLAEAAASEECDLFPPEG